MRNVILLLAGLCIIVSSWGASLSSSRQLMVVLTSDETAIKGQLQRYQRQNIQQRWNKVGGPIAVVIGENGLAPIGLKKEGDGRTP